MSDDGNHQEEQQQHVQEAPIAQEAPLFKLFVGNLSFQTNDEDLRQIFEKYGEVTECRIAVDKLNSRPRGFAFVSMATQEGADEAVKNVTGMDVGGRQIRVELANGERRERGGDRGGDRRGGGDRRDFRGRDDRRGGGGGGYRGGDRRDRSRSRSRSRGRGGGGDFGRRDDNRRGNFDRRGGDDRRGSDDRRGGGDFRDRRDRGRDSR